MLGAVGEVNGDAGTTGDAVELGDPGLGDGGAQASVKQTTRTDSILASSLNF